MNGKKVLVALSGGVDSAVATYLLQQAGYECIGVTMKLFQSEQVDLSKKHSCSSLDDIEDARSIAETLNIPHYVHDFSPRFEEKVIQKFIETYEAGDTPNPCIDCNRYFKFGDLYRKAREMGCDYIATGHYAQVDYCEERGRYRLLKGIDDSRDQSYVLYTMSQDQLAHTLFPLGHLRKSQVREIAEDQGFVNAKKGDSQDICFVPNGDYVDFLESYQNKQYASGNLLNEEGEVIGQHAGAVGYTIGQRRGLGVALGYPAYVIEKSMEDNTVTVGPNGSLYHSGLEAEDFNWVSIARPSEVIDVTARTRYHQRESQAKVEAIDRDRIRLIFTEPQRALTTGQAVVLYSGSEVLGGGTIVKILKDRTD